MITVQRGTSEGPESLRMGQHVPAVQQHGRIPNIGMHLLQLSAFAYIPGTVVAAWLGLWIGCGVLLANISTSLYAHRMHRVSAAPDWMDHVDEFAILLWVVYNAVVVVQLIILLEQSMDAGRLAMLLIALLGASGTVVFDVLRRPLTWRSKRRNAMHVCMHLSGGTGTLVLLCATIG